MLSDGMSYGEIARSANVSRQRVHQLAKVIGVRSHAMEHRRVDRLAKKLLAYKTPEWDWVADEFGKNGIIFHIETKGKKLYPQAEGLPVIVKRVKSEKSKYVNFTCPANKWVVVIMQKSWTIFPPSEAKQRCLPTDPTTARGPRKNIPFAKRITA